MNEGGVGDDDDALGVRLNKKGKPRVGPRKRHKKKKISDSGTGIGDEQPSGLPQARPVIEHVAADVHGTAIPMQTSQAAEPMPQCEPSPVEESSTNFLNPEAEVFHPPIGGDHVSSPWGESSCDGGARWGLDGGERIIGGLASGFGERAFNQVNFQDSMGSSGGGGGGGASSPIDRLDDAAAGPAR